MLSNWHPAPRLPGGRSRRHLVRARGARRGPLRARAARRFVLPRLPARRHGPAFARRLRAAVGGDVCVRTAHGTVRLHAERRRTNPDRAAAPGRRDASARRADVVAGGPVRATGLGRRVVSRSGSATVCWVTPTIARASARSSGGFSSVCARSTRGVEVTDAVVREVTRRAGSVRIDDLAEHVNLSRRHLGRIMNERVGISPKLFARITRFDRAVQLGRTQPDGAVGVGSPWTPATPIRPTWPASSPSSGASVPATFAEPRPPPSGEMSHSFKTGPVRCPTV